MSTLRRSTIALLLSPLLVLAPVASAVAASPAPNPYLGQAKVFYQGLEFEKCLARLDQAKKWKGSSPQELADIEVYGGLCNYNLGKEKEATDHFRAALQQSPTAALPPYTSPKIEALFQKVKDEVAPATPPSNGEKKTEVATTTTEPKKEDVPKKTELAPTGNATASSSTPPGVDDLRVEQKPGGRSLVAPLALGGVSVAAIGAGVVMGLQAKSYEQQAHDAFFESDAVALGKTAQQRATIANVGYAVAAAAATGAVLTFMFAGEPESAQGSAGK